MKKILSLIALLLAFCTAFTSVYADSNLGEALDYLSAADLDLEYDVETIQPEQRVTRAVFAQNVAKLLNLSDVECNNVYYHDVSEDHWAFDNVGILTELGVLSGNGKKYFYPDEFITRNEAATIVVSALGYRAYADNSGGYPNGYLKVANELELFDNCSTNEEITMSDVLIMLRNALDANVANTSMSKNELVYKKSEDTVLNYYHSKYYDKGTLTGCDGITFESTGILDDGMVVIDGIEYETELTGLLDIIGTEVEFIYEADSKDSDERKLVWIKTRDKNDFLDIQKDDKCRFNSDNYTFHYTPEGSENTKKINISEGVIVIYNGAISTRDVEEVLNLDKYKVRFIKSNGNTSYNIAIVWKYDNIVVGNIDSFDHIIYDKFDQGKALDISDDRDKIVIQGGKTVDMLEVGEVLSYYESEDKKLLKIETSKSVTEVTAKWIKEDDNKKILVSDQGEFVFYDTEAEVSVINGETVKLYFDINGYIADIEKVKTEGFPAYLMKVTYDDGEEELILKTLDYDGNIVKRQVAEDAKLDGSKRDMDVIFSSITSERKAVPQVLIIKLDDNGMIKAIDTVSVGDREQADATLRVQERNHRIQYKHHGRLVPKYLISQSTTIFSVPSVPTGDDRDYLVKHKSDMSNDQWYTFDIYRYSEGAIGYEEILVIKDKQWGLSGTDDKLYVLIDEIIGVVNADGDAVEEVTFNRHGSNVKATTTAEFSLLDIGVKSGDLVQISTNMRGEITDAEIKYSYGSDDRPINTTYNAEPGLRVVYAHEKVDNILRIGHESGADFDEAFYVYESDIVVYDEDADEKVRKGTMWDILDYVSVGNSCSTVVIQTIDESPWSVIIYK